MRFSAYAFVTGLAYKFVKKVAGGSQDVRRPRSRRPPRRSRRRRRAEQVQPPPVVAPPPMVRTSRRRRRSRPCRRRRRRRRRRAAAPPPPPPPPPPRVDAAAARPGQSRLLFLGRRLSGRRASRRGQGTTGFRLTIGPDGRVTDCTVTSSSGISCARSGDLPDPAQPRPLHAGARQQRQSDNRHRSAAASPGACRRNDGPRLEFNFESV